MPRTAFALLTATALLLACSRESSSSAPPASSGPLTVSPSGGTAAITADARGFTPTEIHLTKGSPVTLLFTRTTDNTCAKEVVFPELKIRRPLPLNQVVAIMPPTQVEGTYRFQCGMGMWEGSVVVR
jgi:plastocyanin domain-containing protein